MRRQDNRISTGTAEQRVPCRADLGGVVLAQAAALACGRGRLDLQPSSGSEGELEVRTQPARAGGSPGSGGRSARGGVGWPARG